MSDVAQDSSRQGRTGACRWCGAENQTPGRPCQQCHRYSVRLPRWVHVLPSDQKWLTKRRALRYGILLALLAFIVWLNYPFMPDPAILLFKRPTTGVTSTSPPGRWSMVGRDPQLTSFVASVAAQPEGRLAWSQALGENTRSVPTVADGTIYLGAHFKIMALDAETGQTVWEQDTTGPVHSSLTVAGDLLYVGFLDHRLMALGRHTGLKRWEYKTGDAISSSPVVDNGIVYFGSWDGFIYALDAATGKLIWKSETVNDVRSPIAVHQGHLFAGDTSGDLHILSARTGQGRLRFRTPGSISASPSVANGLAYLPAGGKIYAVDVDAREIPGEFQFKQVWAQFWLWQVPGVPRPPRQKGGVWRVSPSSNDTGFIAPPAVTPDSFYAGDTKGAFFSRDALTGANRWQYQAGGGVHGSPLVLGGRVYFGTTAGVLHALDRNTGEVLWQLFLGAPIEISPVFAEGRIYVRTTDGRLHAIE